MISYLVVSNAQSIDTVISRRYTFQSLGKIKNKTYIVKRYGFLIQLKRRNQHLKTVIVCIAVTLTNKQKKKKKIFQEKEPNSAVTVH